VAEARDVMQRFAIGRGEIETIWIEKPQGRDVPVDFEQSLKNRAAFHHVRPQRGAIQQLALQSIVNGPVVGVEGDFPARFKDSSGCGDAKQRWHVEFACDIGQMPGDTALLCDDGLAPVQHRRPFGGCLDADHDRLVGEHEDVHVLLDGVDHPVGRARAGGLSALKQRLDALKQLRRGL